MGELSKKVLIPLHWVTEPRVSTLSELKVSRKYSVFGEFKEINMKSPKYIEDILRDKQELRQRQGLSITPQDFPKKSVEFQYNFSPTYRNSAELAHKRNVIILEALERERVNEEGEDKEKCFNDKDLKKFSGLMREVSNDAFIQKSADGLHKRRRMYERENDISPKPTEIVYEDYSNKFIFSKSKPVFRKKLNFLDVFENSEKNFKKNKSGIEDGSEIRGFRKSSFKIARRLRGKCNIFSSKFLTSGFNS